MLESQPQQSKSVELPEIGVPGISCDEYLSQHTNHDSVFDLKALNKFNWIRTSISDQYASISLLKMTFLAELLYSNKSKLPKLDLSLKEKKRWICSHPSLVWKWLHNTVSSTGSKVRTL